MAKNKTNPRKKQITEYDMKMAQKSACRYAMAIVMTALRRSEGYGRKRMQRVYNEVNYLSDRITKGHTRTEDLISELEQKAGIIIT